jgi:hypothetical protein
MIDLFLSNSITSVSTLYYIFNIKSKETLKIFIISILYDLIITSFIGLHFIIFYILYYLYKIIKIENIYLKYTCMLISYKKNRRRLWRVCWGKGSKFRLKSTEFVQR